MSARPGPWSAFVVALIFLALAIMAGFWRPREQVLPPPKILWKLTALAPEPSWDDIAAANATHGEFTTALGDVYGFDNSWADTIKITPTHAEITIATATPEANPLRLDFHGGPPRQSPLAGFWRPAATLPPLAAGKPPLDGVRIAIDPGHIGGDWAKMEERWYQVPEQPTQVMEGELTLKTAEVLRALLEPLGATVRLVRDKLEPVTAQRPSDFASQTSSAEQRELYFYRKAELRARADLVNNEIRPDVVICLHFNAETWGDPNNVQLIMVNHLHLIVNGHYSADELNYDDVRCDMLRRLLQGIHHEEIRLADAVATAMARSTGLPPYDYGQGHMAQSAHRVLPGNPYVWARNLMANRLYLCPVIYCEPYVMNSREVYQRLAAGDYEGEKMVAGKNRRSLFREYARGVADGLKTYYETARRSGLAQ
ncbi:MAG: N-acetylmuramoyl-L-alanine amidase [Verrucomicrobiales bacterium]